MSRTKSRLQVIEFDSGSIHSRTLQIFLVYLADALHTNSGPSTTISTSFA
ncbi:hypothetical protein [Nitrosomonas communis]|nr:hypothetical protein [Nitrosomonas communis]MCO6426867.1 hypothetical protein [Nitrosomonas communis]